MQDSVSGRTCISRRYVEGFTSKRVNLVHFHIYKCLWCGSTSVLCACVTNNSFCLCNRFDLTETLETYTEVVITLTWRIKVQKTTSFLSNVGTAAVPSPSWNQIRHHSPEFFFHSLDSRTGFREGLAFCKLLFYLSRSGLKSLIAKMCRILALDWPVHSL